ncbi:MAG TPA: hypothetical protein PLZ73_03965 [bacterium]|nr:hypothetical protein [bacterium]
MARIRVVSLGRRLLQHVLDFPVFLLIVFELARTVITGSRAGKGCLWFLTGFLGGVAVWEAVNFAVCSLWIGYTPFPLRLLEGIRHNAANAAPLPSDPLFFWRHLALSEGWLSTGLLAAGAAAGTIAVVRRNCGKRPALLRLVFLFWGVAQGMNAFGGTQVIRHYFPGFLAGVIVTGWWLSGWRRHKRWCGWAAAAAVLAVAARQYREVGVYRESRSAPALLEKWEQETGRRGEGASMAMQQWDLWPSLTMLKDREELEDFARRHPRGHIMYSDYIGIAHGAWFYHNREELLLAETLRACRRPLFAAPSYLSYQPMLFENEYYYWGLLRGRPERFDPAVRVFSVAEVLRARAEILRDASLRRALAAQLLRPPPLRIPAWRRRIVLPYLESGTVPGRSFQGRLWEALAPLGLLVAGLLRQRGRLPERDGRQPNPH